MNTSEEPTNSFNIILFACRTWVMKVKIRLGPKFPHGKGRCLVVITYMDQFFTPCEQGSSWNWRAQVIIPGDYNMQNHQQTTTKTTNFEPPLCESLRRHLEVPDVAFCIENPWILQLPGRRKAAWTPVLRVVTSLGIILWRGERWVKDEFDTVWYILHKNSWTYFGPFRLVGFGYGLTVLPNDLPDSLLAFCVFGVDSWCIDLPS